MKSRIQRVKTKTANVTYRPQVFFQIGIAPIVSVGTNTFAHELIKLAGGKYLSKGPIPYPRFSKEQVLFLSPEVFIITSMSRNTILTAPHLDWWTALNIWHDPSILNYSGLNFLSYISRYPHNFSDDAHAVHLT